MVEPTSNATPSATSWKPGQIAVIVDAVVHGDRDGPVAGAQRALQRRRARAGRRASPVERPVALERLEQALQIAAGVGEIGLADLDVVQPHDRVDLDRVRVGFLAHDLAMDLALGRHVDDEVAADAGVAAEPAVGGEPAPLAIARLRLAERREVVGASR